MYSRHVSGILQNCFHSRPSINATKNVHINNCFSNKYRHSTMCSKFKCYQYRMSLWLREQSIQVVKACTRQCEFIAAQRIRRSLQIFHLYSRIWDEVALREFIKFWRQRVTKNAKEFLVTAVGISMFDWEKERIPNLEMYR